jgi:hypothetical protein
MQIARLALAALTSMPLLVPLPAYPQAAPLPAEGNRLPSFVDDDERVHAQLAPDGRVVGMRSTMRIQVAGSGDYVMVLPGTVEAVADQGGDSVPGLRDGKVSFLGHLDGKKLLAAEARLDPSRYAQALPVSVDISYSQGASSLDAAAATGHGGDFSERIRLRNLTGKPAALTAGRADRRALAQTLEALRGVPGVYTPETDLAQLFPLPPNLDIASPQPATVQAFVPMAFDVTVQLEASVTAVTAPGATVATDGRGTRVHWTLPLPTDTDSGGDRSLDLAFHTDRFRVPAVSATVVVQPLPSALFTPPGGGAWSNHLASADAGTLNALSLKAQAGALSLHRIGDLAPPVGRPGPGPERVSYDFVLDSGAQVVDRPPPAPPLKPEPWAWALVGLGVLVVGANAWWAWSRN